MKNVIKKIIFIIIAIENRIFYKNIISFRSKYWKVKLNGKNIKIYENVKITYSQVGKNTYIGKNSSITKAKIGSYCSIAPGLKCVFGRHPTRDFVSTHPFFYSKKFNSNIKEDLFKEYKYIDSNNEYCVEIGNDVWIGENVILLDGVKIGDGAIIGAGSVVTKDINPYEIVGGVPAKVIRKRFNDEDILFLKKIKWWDKDDKWIEDNYLMFSNIEKFKEFLKWKN